MSVESSHSQYHQQLHNYIRKRKQMESDLQCGPSDFVLNLVKNVKLDELEIQTSQAMGKVFSNDMTDACRTVCKICERQVTLNFMRTHAKNKHKMTIREYKNKFGNHRKQIVNVVYHKCALCCAEIILDADSIDKHVRRHHQTSLKDYNSRYITSSKAGAKRKFNRKTEHEDHDHDHTLESLVEESFNMLDFGGPDTIQELDSLFDSL